MAERWLEQVKPEALDTAAAKPQQQLGSCSAMASFLRSCVDGIFKMLLVLRSKCKLPSRKYVAWTCASRWPQHSAGHSEVCSKRSTSPWLSHEGWEKALDQPPEITPVPGRKSRNSRTDRGAATLTGRKMKATMVKFILTPPMTQSECPP